MQEGYDLRIIGKVVSPAKTSKDLTLQGVEAEAHIFDEYSDALDGIEHNSHIFVICWMHESDRDSLKVIPRRISADSPPKGVFSLRSPIRPNPLSLSPTRLLERDGNILRVENLDMIDGTPIIDIKPYSTAWDCVFSARNNSSYYVYSRISKEDALADMLRQAANFHGDRCIGVSIGVRAAYTALNHFKCDLQDKGFTINANVRGCIADALQSLFSMGNKRFSNGEPNDTVTFEKDGKTLTLLVTKDKFRDLDTVLTVPDEKIFTITESRFE